MKDELLWRLESFEIDKPGVAFPFSARLARENGWADAYARRVVREYLRFVWLAMRAGHPVTPSMAVDEAWHLHLCYTRSYWDELCGLLGRPLHHGPTEGGGAEDAKFVDWYGKTLESYRCHFGEEPPADIWPSVAERFRRSGSRMIDPRTHLILSKRRVRRCLAGVAGVVILPVLVGCTPLMANFEPGGLICFGILALFVVVLSKLGIRSGRSTRRRRGRGFRIGSGAGGSAGSGSSGSYDGGSSSDSGCGSSGCSSSGCGSSGCGGGGCGGGGGD